MTSRSEDSLRCEMESETPREIYQAAIQERKSRGKLKKRAACEKAWLAVVKAVDAYLDGNDLHVDSGDEQAFSKRQMNLGILARRSSQGESH